MTKTTAQDKLDTRLAAEQAERNAEIRAAVRRYALNGQRGIAIYPLAVLNAAFEGHEDEAREIENLRRQALVDQHEQRRRDHEERRIRREARRILAAEAREADAAAQAKAEAEALEREAAARNRVVDAETRVRRRFDSGEDTTG